MGMPREDPAGAEALVRPVTQKEGQYLYSRATLFCFTPLHYPRASYICDICSFFHSTNPGNNLHVSGLSHKVDTRDLESAFAKIGRVRLSSTVLSLSYFF